MQLTTEKEHLISTLKDYVNGHVRIDEKDDDFIGVSIITLDWPKHLDYKYITGLMQDYYGDIYLHSYIPYPNGITIIYARSGWVDRFIKDINTEVSV